MKIDCPHCGVHGSVDDSLAGSKLRCPKCAKVFLITDDMLPDTDEHGLVHQEIFHDPAPAVPPAVELKQETEEAADVAEEIVADEETKVTEDEMSDLMPVSADEDEDLEFDDSREGGESEDQASTVEDDGVLAFSGDDDDSEELEPAVTPDSLEVCSGCGESLHPQFLDSFEGKQYCALCFPEDNEENLQLSDETDPEEEEAIELDASESASTLMADDVEDDESEDDLELEAEEQSGEPEETEDSETATEDEDLDEEGFPEKACSVCGDKFHTDFLQEIDSKLYCGVCQPEVIETVSSDVMPAVDGVEEEDGLEVVEEPVEDVEEVQDRGTDFTVGDTIKEAWQKTKGAKGAIWGAVFVMYLILFGISFAGFYGSQSMMGSDPTTVMGVNGGLQLITSWLSMLMTGGLMLIGVRRALEQRVSWKMVFAAFSGEKVLSMTIAAVLQILLIAIGFLLLIIPGIYLTVGYALALPLILDKGLGPWEALETSRKAIHKKWWTVLGMYLVMMLLYAVSMIPLGLGLIWTVPMFMVLIGVLYGRLFGYSDMEESEEEAEENEEETEGEEEDVSEELAEESEESL